MRHFEQTWEEAEDMVDSVSTASCVTKIKDLLDEFNNSNNTEILGEVLFEIAKLSKEHNINVDAALKQHINNLKIDQYG